MLNYHCRGRQNNGSNGIFYVIMFLIICNEGKMEETSSGWKRLPHPTDNFTLSRQSYEHVWSVFWELWESVDVR